MRQAASAFNFSAYHVGVIAGPAPANHASLMRGEQDAGGRNKPGYDGSEGE
jgi:hypothetical protein